MNCEISCNYQQKLNVSFKFNHHENVVIQNNAGQELSTYGVRVWKHVSHNNEMTLDFEVKSYGKVIGWLLSLVKVSFVAKQTNASGEEESFYVNKKSFCKKIIRAKQLVSHYQTAQNSALKAYQIDAITLRVVLNSFKNKVNAEKKIGIRDGVTELLGVCSAFNQS